VKPNKSYDVIILGAGAAGLMCAGQLNAHTPVRVLIIEGNDKPGMKLKISGGGKCNITNTDVQPHHFLGDQTLVRDTLSHFSKEQLIGLLEDHGLNPVIRKGRYYFCPKSSDEIIAILTRRCAKSEIAYRHKITALEYAEGLFSVACDQGTYSAPRVVVATGGASYVSVGASRIGLELAESFGHTVKPFQPALVGLTLQSDQAWMKALTGISFPVRIEADGRIIEEDMLFAHRGISGPAILSASLYWQKGTIGIDFLPHQRLEKQLFKYPKKLLSTAIDLPKRFVKAFLDHLGIEDKPCARLDKTERQTLMQLHDYRFAPAGNFGFTKAEASKGGVVTDELDHCSLESLRQPGLHFIGEVVDVTGELGGYNFQWAFSSAVMCADGIIKEQA
jgi:predicted Rossmann fold flavoprotein